MDHADIQVVGVVRVADLYDLSILLDRALLRLIESEQDAHQSGLSCSVLAQQGMDLALFQLERHIIIGLDAWELLGDVEHFDDIFVQRITSSA